MVSMFKPLSPDLKPQEVTVALPPGIELPDFDDPAIWNYFTPFSVKAVGEDVKFHAALLLPGRNQEALSEHTLPHVHWQSRDAKHPDDWRIILNLDPRKPLLFRYLNAYIDEGNDFALDEAPGGHYIDDSPIEVPSQMRVKTFQNHIAKGIAFRAGEVAHTGCAAEILGNRAVIFAQQPYLPDCEDRFAKGAAFLDAEAAYESRLQPALPEQG